MVVLLQIRMSSVLGAGRIDSLETQGVWGFDWISSDSADLVDISSPISSGTPSGSVGTMLVVGCTGFLGQYLTAEAVGQGW